MTPEQLDEKLKDYRVNKARCAYLRHQMESLKRYLAICKGTEISDQISLSQAISGMPHGSGVGDPTGRLAIDIADGKVGIFVKQIQEEMVPIQIELNEKEKSVREVEIVLEALSEREREIVTLKAIDDLPWQEALDQMNDKHGGTYAKRTIQRLYDRAMEKAYKTVAGNTTESLNVPNALKWVI